MLASGALAPADQFINKHQNSEIKTCSENWLDICTFGQGRTYAHFWPDIRTFYGRTYAHFIAGHMHISWPDICTYSTAKAVPPAGQGGQNLKIWLRHNLRARPKRPYANFQVPRPPPSLKKTRTKAGICQIIIRIKLICIPRHRFNQNIKHM